MMGSLMVVAQLSTAYWWSTGLFVTGAVIAALMFHKGRPESGEPSAPLVHM